MSALWRKWFQMESEPSPQAFPAPLFIVGCMRSGTSLLVDKLTQHPQLLKIGVELNDIWTAIGDAPCIAPDAYRDESHASYPVAHNMAAYFANFIKESRRPRRHLMRAKNLWRDGKGSAFLDWAHLIPVNKSPHLSNKLRYVHALFPQSKILFIIRGMEGQSASMKIHYEGHHQRGGYRAYFPQDPQAGFSLGQGKNIPTEVVPDRMFPGDFSMLPEMWIRLNAIALQDLEELPQEAYRILVYEDLVEKQPEVLAQVFDFLETQPKHRVAEEKIAHSGMKVINTTSSGNPLEKWRKTLSENEIAQLEAVIAAHRVKYDFIQQQIQRHKR